MEGKCQIGPHASPKMSHRNQFKDPNYEILVWIGEESHYAHTSILVFLFIASTSPRHIITPPTLRKFRIEP